MVSTQHLLCFQGDRWGNIHFQSKPRHVTPQINCLRKPSPVLRVSTHIYYVSKEIDGKTFIFRVNLGIWPLKSIISEKQALFWGFQHTFIMFPRRLIGKCSFLSKPSHLTPQINRLRKTSPVLRVSTHIYGCFQGDRWENVHFLRKLRHVTPQIDHLMEKWAFFWGFSTHISGNSHANRWENMSFCIVNLGMWPLKSIVLDKQALFWGFQHTFMVFPRR